MGRQKVKQEKGGLTNEAKRLDAFWRIGNLEQAQAALVKAVNNSFQEVAQGHTNLSKSIEDLNLFLQAMIEVMDGPDKKVSTGIGEAFDRLKKEKLETEGEKKLAELKIMETEGKIAKVDAVESENDFVVTSQKGADGTQKYPTKQPSIVGLFIPAVKELLIGKKAGETITLPDGGTLEIVEVYKLVEAVEEIEYDLEATAGQTAPETPETT